MTPHTTWSDSAAVGTLPTEPTRSDFEVVEMQLLLPKWQAVALEAAARDLGMTTGQILRRVITDLFGGTPPSPR